MTPDRWHPIAREMAIRNVSQRRVACLVGISNSYLSLLLRGKRRMSERMERRIMRVVKRRKVVKRGYDV